MQISTAADGTALSLESGYSLNEKCAIHISQRNDCAQQGDVKQTVLGFEENIQDHLDQKKG